MFSSILLTSTALSAEDEVVAGDQGLPAPNFGVPTGLTAIMQPTIHLNEENNTYRYKEEDGRNPQSQILIEFPSLYFGYCAICLTQRTLYVFVPIPGIDYQLSLAEQVTVSASHRLRRLDSHLLYICYLVPLAIQLVHSAFQLVPFLTHFFVLFVDLFDRSLKGKKPYAQLIIALARPLDFCPIVALVTLCQQHLTLHVEVTLLLEGLRQLGPDALQLFLLKLRGHLLAFVSGCSKQS